MDDGSWVEIKDPYPLTRAKQMQAAGAFVTPIAATAGDKTIVQFSDAEIVAEIGRQMMIRCYSDRELVDECIRRHLVVTAQQQGE